MLFESNDSGYGSHLLVMDGALPILQEQGQKAAVCQCDFLTAVKICNLDGIFE